MVVTNDEMRDHHFQMLSHRSFLRWKERHCVRFRIGPQTAEVEAKSFVFFQYGVGGFGLLLLPLPSATLLLYIAI